MLIKHLRLLIYFTFFCFILSENNFKSIEYIPDVILKDLDKKKVKLLNISDNKFIVFNFWNMACEPCKKEMKFLNEFHKKYNDYDFKVISVNMDSPRSMSKVKKYVKSSKYEFEVTLNLFFLKNSTTSSFSFFG